MNKYWIVPPHVQAAICKVEVPMCKIEAPPKCYCRRLATSQKTDEVIAGYESIQTARNLRKDPRESDKHVRLEHFSPGFSHVPSPVEMQKHCVWMELDGHCR
jgi:hypothetical protein